MALSVTQVSREGKTILQLEGRIDANNAQAAEAELFQYLEPGTATAVDFSNLAFLSSAGLRIFLLMAKKAKAGGGSVVLFALPPVVKDVFEISGFSRIITIKENEDEALQALG